MRSRTGRFLKQSTRSEYWRPVSDQSCLQGGGPIQKSGRDLGFRPHRSRSRDLASNPRFLVRGLWCTLCSGNSRPQVPRGTRSGSTSFVPSSGPAGARRLRRSRPVENGCSPGKLGMTSHVQGSGFCSAEKKTVALPARHCDEFTSSSRDTEP